MAEIAKLAMLGLLDRKMIGLIANFGGNADVRVDERVYAAGGSSGGRGREPRIASAARSAIIITGA
jgi:hypothetical protein